MCRSWEVYQGDFMKDCIDLISSLIESGLTYEEAIHSVHKYHGVDFNVRSVKELVRCGMEKEKAIRLVAKTFKVDRSILTNLVNK